MTDDALEPETAALLAHGALNSLTTVSTVVDLLADMSSAGEATTSKAADLARAHMRTLADSLRFIASGLPGPARDALDDLDAARPGGRGGAARIVDDIVGDDGGSRETSRAETRRLVQEAALRLAETRGFEETNVADIAAASYISTRTFFRHFDSKHEAIWSWVDDEVARLADFVRAAPHGMHDVEALRFGVRAYALDVAGRDETASRYISLLAESPSFTRMGLEQTAVHAVSAELAARAGVPTPSMQHRVLARTAAAAIAAAMEEHHLRQRRTPLSGLIVTALNVALPAGPPRA